MGILEDILAVQHRQLAALEAIAKALDSKLIDVSTEVAAVEKHVAKEAQATAEVTAPKRVGRPRKNAVTDVEVKPAKEETVAPPEEEVVAEAESEEEAFEYDTLKAAIIELANISPAGRAKVLEIFTKYKVPGNKAQNAHSSLWPVLYDAAVAALTELQQAADEDPAEVEFT